RATLRQEPGRDRHLAGRRLAPELRRELPQLVVLGRLRAACRARAHSCAQRIDSPALRGRISEAQRALDWKTRNPSGTAVSPNAAARSAGSEACSGCGIKPKIAFPGPTMPAMSRADPSGLYGWSPSGTWPARADEPSERQ